MRMASGSIKEWGERKRKSEIMIGDEVNAPGFHDPMVVVEYNDFVPQILEALEQLKG